MSATGTRTRQGRMLRTQHVEAGSGSHGADSQISFALFVQVSTVEGMEVEEVLEDEAVDEEETSTLLKTAEGEDVVEETVESVEVEEAESLEGGASAVEGVEVGAELVEVEEETMAGPE
jgi:hypothetical protein